MGGLTILTWHVHGSYLEALARTGHDFVVPVRSGRPPRYGGRPADVAWPPNIREVPAEAVRDLDVDLVLYQHPENWTVEQHEILGPAQLRGPRIFLEHDPPREHPTDTRHPVDDPDVLLVHVTAYNALMWDPGRTPTRVIDHGVEVPPDVLATLELERGVVVVNDLARRGRR
ncbi:MAG: glycosyltransferase family 1 protein, partial [Chloroflexi bacterium]|nr:glycosyltransferase family 1 protein [Chloroflexota bacterium]